MRALAPAKLNLTLRIVGKRSDGYHLLESLVAFTDLHDVLEVTAAETLSLRVTGPFAAACGAVEENLVLRAARLLGTRGAAFTLTKNIPPGAGLGGGSADAAAALQLLNACWGLRLSDAQLQAYATQLGADVAMFLRAPQPLIARGIGEEITPLPTALPPLHAVLVYPHQPLATPAVYGAYQHAPGDAPALVMTDAWLSQIMASRNALQSAAMGLMPEISQMLQALEVTPALLARMTGSGACCFALYDRADAAQASAIALHARYPQWWVQATALLGG